VIRSVSAISNSAHYGLAAVVGCPLSGRLPDWLRVAQDVDELAILNRRPEKLHGTLANLTQPAGRSVSSERRARQSAEITRGKLLRLMWGVLEGVDPFDLNLHPPRVSGNAIILPSVTDPRIFELKARLQGDRRGIPENDVPSVLASDISLGIDKSSTGHSQLRPSISITLGETETHDGERVRSMLRSLPSVPAIRVGGIRLAFYRDRRLDDATVSGSLDFGASQEMIENVISEFFEVLGGP
jgi:hypothetical protein